LTLPKVAKNGQRTWLLVLLAAMALSLAVGTVPAHGQGRETDEGQATGRVQALSGRAAKGANVFCTLPGLKEGQLLTVYVAGTSGNLDPLTGLTDARTEGDALKEAFFGDVARMAAEGRDPLEALPEIYDKYFLAWDDDSGAGHDDTLKFRDAHSNELCQIQ
jgi:hypothetical protein